MFQIFNSDGLNPERRTRQQQQFRARTRATARRRAAGSTEQIQTRPPVRSLLSGRLPAAHSNEQRTERGPAVGLDRSQLSNIVAEVIAQTESAHRIQHPVRTSDQTAKQTLSEFYAQTLAPERERRVRLGKNRPGTVAKDKTALAMWERYGGGELPLNQIDADACQEWLCSALKSERRGSLKGLAAHLRWMLNTAFNSGVITAKPDFSFPKARRTDDASASEFHGALIYELNGDVLATLSAICSRLNPELQFAFKVGATIGARAQDLLSLRYSQFDLDSERPTVRFIADKTGTFHEIPLPPWLVETIKREQRDALYLFPCLTGHGTADPGKSRANRRTTAELKAACIDAGFDFGGKRPHEQKPWQVLRATCNERYTRHHARAGEWILGHAIGGVNRQSYQSAGQWLVDAVGSLPQPADWIRTTKDVEQ